MGMYTEIIFGAGLDAPQEVITILEELIDGKAPNELTYCPQHTFFTSERPWLLNSGGSYYFPGFVTLQLTYDETYEGYYLHFRTNIKNYDEEIEKFLDWIKSYIDQGSGNRDFYAIVMYEDSEIPTIYYLEENEKYNTD